MTAVVLALAGTTFGYAALSKAVTLSLDGQDQQVPAIGDTVGDVLDAEGIEVGDHDVVAPGLDEPVNDGSRIAVRFGRPLELERRRREARPTGSPPPTSPRALGEIGRASRRRPLRQPRRRHRPRGHGPRGGHPQDRSRSRSAGKKPVKRNVTALTVARRPRRSSASRSTSTTWSSPASTTELERRRQGRLHRHPGRHQAGQARGRRLRHRRARGLLDVRGRDRDRPRRRRRRPRRDLPAHLPQRRAGHAPRSSAGRPARAGRRDRQGRHQGAAAANFAGGNTVWDPLAQCEAGGNWAINTGNGYYGGLQFNLGTWQAYGGSGLPAPAAAARPRSRSPTKVRDATGGYGSWPACSQSLGLPQLTGR